MKPSALREESLKDGYRTGVVEGQVQGLEKAVTIALDAIGKGGDGGTKATRTAWNMACAHIAQTLRKVAATREMGK